MSVKLLLQETGAHLEEFLKRRIYRMESNELERRFRI